MAMNETFVKMVKEGKKIWRREDFDSIGISKEMKKEAGIVDCPRWSGWVQGSGDGVKLNVDGICVTVYGTSNMTADEKRWYYDHKGQGTGTPRSSTAAPSAKVVEETIHNKEMAIRFLNTLDNPSMSQYEMLLEMAGASQMAKMLFKSRDDWNKGQVIMLMNMNDL